MNINLKQRSAIIGLILGTVFQLHAQGYIVPNGVITNYSGAFHPGEISVVHDPTNSYYTGFFLDPQVANTFLFLPILDIGVRVFFVSPNDPISLQPILANSYMELSFPNTYVFNRGVPFYVGFYTGNVPWAPQDGIYNDPLFGWAELVNDRGVIRLLDSALEYRGGGIYAGTQNLIPIPEPSVFCLAALGGLSFVFHHWRNKNQRQ